MCEVLPTDYTGEIVVLGQNSQATLTMETAVTPVVSHPRSDFNHFAKMNLADGSSVYLRLDIEYLGACNSAANTGCIVATEECGVCDLGESGGATTVTKVDCSASVAAEFGFECVAKATSSADNSVALAEAERDAMMDKKNTACSADPESPECKTAETELKNAEDALASALDANAAGPSEESGGSTGTIVAVVVVLLLLILIAVGVVLYRKQNEKVTNMRTRMTTYEQNSAVVQNRTFVQDPAIQQFVAGQKNPLYDWYHPAMTRGDCDIHFKAQGDGAFVVRDSQATPGWHMLCVKTDGAVLHDKIRQTDDGKYELLPTTPDGHDGARQPIFDNLPELVDFYTQQRSGVGYTLTLANDVRQDMDDLYGGDYGDNSAPALPGKGAAPLDNPMYAANMAVEGDSSYQ